MAHLVYMHAVTAGALAAAGLLALGGFGLLLHRDRQHFRDLARTHRLAQLRAFADSLDRRA
jgi:hypothetical protein